MTKNVNLNHTSSQVFPPDSKPFGLTYGEWSAKWWQWALSIPKEKSPFIDETGKNCGEGQNDPNVFFLAGTLGGPAKRTCPITSDKAIFFPIINYEGNFIEDKNIETESELIHLVKSQIADITHYYSLIDSDELKDLSRYRVRSPLFNLRFSDNNIFNVPPETTMAVTDGYYIMLKPLPCGRHTIKFGGSCLAGKIRMDITYYIFVL